jgi:uncharacterized protein YgiM (DUF1202 family)
MSIAPASAETIEVTGDYVNVRSGPGTNYKVVTVWSRGVQGNRIKQQGGWSYVVTGPVEGWVSSAYVKPAGGSSGSPYQYRASGSIENARFKGAGIGEVRVTGNTAKVKVTANQCPQVFTTIYDGSIYSNSNSLIRVSVEGFESMRTGGTRVPSKGNCEISFDPNRQLRSINCLASEVLNLDHGRTIFTKR